MKQVNILMLALIVLMGGGFTSCMDGDSESPYDIAAYVTVSSYLGLDATLISDDGYKYKPTNPDFLKNKTTGEYVERAFVYLKLSEGVSLTQDQTKEYSVSIVDAQGLFTKTFCNRPDTIKNEYPIVQLGEAWATDRYYNIAFSFNGYATSPASFDMVPKRAENNTLYVKFVQTVGQKDVYNPLTAFISFNIPYLSAVNTLLSTYENPTVLKADDEGFIELVVEADKTGGTLQKEPLKVKLR